MRTNRKSSFRLGAASVLALVCLFTLSSCIFANNISPVEVGVVNGHVTLAFCVSGTVEAISVEQRPSTSSDQWETVWQGEGEYKVQRGDILTLDGLIDGFTGGGEGLIDVSEGAKYGLIVTYRSNRAGGVPVDYGPSFNAPGGGLVEGVWLDYSGGASNTPCD